MPEDAPTPPADEPKTSRVEHVRIGEGEKLTAKKVPPWGIALIVGGVAILGYYLYKKHQESATTTATTETPTTAYSGEGYPAGGYAGYGTGGGEQNSNLMALIEEQKKEAKEQQEKWHTEEKEAREKGEGTLKGIIESVKESMKPAPPPTLIVGNTSPGQPEGLPSKSTEPGVPVTPAELNLPPNIPRETVMTIGGGGGTGTYDNPGQIAEGEKTRLETAAKAAALTASPQVNPTQPGAAKSSATSSQTNSSK